MQNPQMPNMPGAGAMNDSLEFVKNLWGTMGVPGITAPTLSVDDLDKKIKDLKAVEIWLNVNTQMLRGTIQALEVQRGTLTALRSMGEAMASQAGTNPFAAFTQPVAGAQETPQKAAPAQEAGAKAAEGGHTPAGDATAAAMEMANPAMWWNMMQEQFQQALAQAAAAGGTAAAPAAAPDDKPAGGEPKSKPHARKRAE